MKPDRAIPYLMKNQLLNMDMIEAIRRGTAEFIYSDMDGVFIKEQKSKAYMISVDNFEKGVELINKISECGLIVAHQKFMADYIFERFKLNEKLECFQAVYLSNIELEVKDLLSIRQLKQEQIETVLDHYDILSKEEIHELIKNGYLFGGYRDNELIGFVGNHIEGSIGILEVFPQYRCHGYGTILESYMINKMLHKGLVPFGQIEINNLKSLALQRKLGFTLSKDIVYWMF